jgi:hypothetical protein
MYLRKSQKYIEQSQDNFVTAFSMISGGIYIISKTIDRPVQFCFQLNITVFEF